MLQNLGLIQGQTVLENVMLPLLLSGTCPSPELTALKVLEILNIKKKKHCNEDLSGGQQQELPSPEQLSTVELILADEPTATLDHETASEVMELFRKLNREWNCTVLISTHDPAIASYGTRQMRIQDGILQTI